MSLPRGTGPAPPAVVARVLLDWIVAWYGDRADDSDPEAPEPLPARRYVAGGAPREVAWDSTDGQVTVAVERLLLGLDTATPPGPVRSPRRDPSNVGRVQRSVRLEAQVVRCAPALASVEVLHGHGLSVARDSGHLVSAVTDAAKEGVLIREHVAQANIVIDDLVTLGPSGGAAGVAVAVTVPLL